MCLVNFTSIRTIIQKYTVTYLCKIYVTHYVCVKFLLNHMICVKFLLNHMISHLDMNFINLKNENSYSNTFKNRLCIKKDHHHIA